MMMLEDYVVQVSWRGTSCASVDMGPLMGPDACVSLNYLDDLPDM
jgi:hypothetical protein